MTKPLNSLLPERLAPMTARLPEVTSLVLIVACTYVLARLSWALLVPVTPPVTPAPVNTQAATSTASGEALAIRQLTQAHLFGVASRAAAPVATSPAPRTRLNLVLRGVLSADPTNTASAIIAQGKNGKEDIYGIDDRLPGGVVVREIHAEHVVLERQGRLETLELQKESGVGEISASQPDISENNSSPGAALQTIRENILKNPTSFAEYALPVVVRENGRQIGYRLQPQKKGNLLSQLGLEANDVITEINGIKLDQPQNGIGALRKLSTASQVDVMVQRNGNTVPLSIQLQ